MTWAELHRVLRDRGLVRADDALRAAASVGAVTGIAYDSRAVGRGDVFVAWKGLRADGTAFARQAIEAGAVAVVSEAPAPPDVHVPWAIVDDARLALALLAAAFQGHPSEAMQVVGITGTNGKTTTAYLIASIFETAGVRCGLLGTVVYRVGAEMREATRTTPEAPDVQRLLREMVDAGCGACAMEVSSHALALQRVDGMRFSAAVFTNLTRDHLDFHGDMESYFQAKRRLFEMLPRDAPAIVNADDARAPSLASAGGRPITYGLSRADVTCARPSLSLDGLRLDVTTPWGRAAIRSKLVGRPNVYNVLAAVAATGALDVPLDAVARGVESLDGVPGRFQVVSTAADDVTVVVDYAHTDDALRNLLETARAMAPGRLVTVFGCGGDRDRTKRPLMGAVASRLSDVIVVTSDNPRSEDPQRIVDDIHRGLTPDTRRDASQRLLTILDRREAIETAVGLAAPRDVVLVAGKGHETYQAIGDRVLPFDDAAVAKSALARRRAQSGVA